VYEQFEHGVGRVREDLRSEKNVPAANPLGERDVPRCAEFLEGSTDLGERVGARP
jgi:hypothetical protein